MGEVVSTKVGFCCSLYAAQIFLLPKGTAHVKFQVKYAINEIVLSGAYNWC